MSRIGNAPISIPDGVTVDVNDAVVTVKGAKGELTQEISPAIKCKIEEGILTLERTNEEKQTKALHGLYRSLINNMVEGVSQGYTIKQELVGVGYRAKVQGQKLEVALGFSHPIIFELPTEIKVSAEQAKGQNPIITLESHDKQLIGQVAAKIRSFRKPEPYKGKGVRFVGEHIRRKAGKAAGK
ncbi:MAG: 50S ribosomal protein L6 [Flavobacteriales bacterium]|nr:50S ribosomal protein L6 [Flavobacteriales bacterium]